MKQEVYQVVVEIPHPLSPSSQERAWEDIRFKLAEQLARMLDQNEDIFTVQYKKHVTHQSAGVYQYPSSYHWLIGELYFTPAIRHEYHVMDLKPITMVNPSNLRDMVFQETARRIKLKFRPLTRSVDYARSTWRKTRSRIEQERGGLYW